ncbi:hypothetical protein QTP70_032803, partial [Hemibagrus guttatus]
NTIQATIPQEYNDLWEVFSKERAADLPAHRPWDCAIELINNAMQAPKCRLYPLSIPERRAMEEYIEEALASGYIRPSTSTGGGLIFLPALEQLRGATVFTKLDLRSAYNLVHIKEGDKCKTAFHTSSGHFEYLVKPYGLTNALAVFQSLINKVFRDILNKYVIAYIDDILIYSSSLTEHIQHVRTILNRLLSICFPANLYPLPLTLECKKLHLCSLFYSWCCLLQIMMENGRSRRFGFVCFKSSEEAMIAMKEMNGRMWGRKPVYVGVAQRREEHQAYLTHLNNIPQNLDEPALVHQQTRSTERPSSSQVPCASDDCTKVSPPTSVDTAPVASVEQHPAVDSVPAVETVQSMDSVPAVETVQSVGSVPAVETVQSVDIVPAVETVRSVDSVPAVETI